MLERLSSYVMSNPIDPQLLRSYQVGLAMGVVILTTLAFFPGEPWGISYGTEDENLAPTEKEDATASPSSSATHNKKNVSPTSPPRQRPEVHGLSHRQLNRRIYLVLLSVMVLVLNEVYGHSLSWFFAVLFPKEANTLGMALP